MTLQSVTSRAVEHVELLLMEVLKEETNAFSRKYLRHVHNCIAVVIKNCTAIALHFSRCGICTCWISCHS